MINEPSVDVMVKKLGVNNEDASRYALCVVASKRARQLVEQQQYLGKTKELTSACNEIISDKLRISND